MQPLILASISTHNQELASLILTMFGSTDTCESSLRTQLSLRAHPRRGVCVSEQSVSTRRGVCVRTTIKPISLMLIATD